MNNTSQIINWLSSKLSVANIAIYASGITGALGISAAHGAIVQACISGALVALAAVVATIKERPASKLNALHEFAQNIDDDLTPDQKAAILSKLASALLVKPTTVTASAAPKVATDSTAPAISLGAK